MPNDFDNGPQFRKLSAALRDKGPGDKKKPSTKPDATDVARTRAGLAAEAAKSKADASQSKWAADSSDYVNDRMDVKNFFGPGDAKKIIQDGKSLGWFERAMTAREDRDAAEGAASHAQAAGVRNPDEHTAALIHHLVKLQQQ